MEEVLILSMLLCAGLAILGFRYRSFPILVVSSLGWILVSFQIHDSYQDPLLPMVLLWMLAMTQPLIGGRE